MRATSSRRAPQRHITDRTLGETGAPLAPGACPHCFRVIKILASGRRAHHLDRKHLRCTGSGIRVSLHEVRLDVLPPVAIPPRREPQLPTIRQPRPPRTRRPAVSPIATQPASVTLDGRIVDYAGGSDRAAAHGRVVCPSCGRHLPRNSDGSIRRHRIRHQDPFAPYCDTSRDT